MGGGHFDYAYFHLDAYEGNMEDPELEELLDDFRNILHDLEWYRSGDTSRSDYIESVNGFKQKWFKADRNERLVRIINEQCDSFKHRLNELVGA